MRPSCVLEVVDGIRAKTALKNARLGWVLGMRIKKAPNASNKTDDSLRHPRPPLLCL